jgi:5-methyltetrahydropteroyltriglutamate--homocysteine methyltransferase
VNAAWTAMTNSEETPVTIQQNTDHIQTTHIGSLPRPHNLLDLLKAKYAGLPYDESKLNVCASKSSAALRS